MCGFALVGLKVVGGEHSKETAAMAAPLGRLFFFFFFIIVTKREKISRDI